MEVRGFAFGGSVISGFQVRGSGFSRLGDLCSAIRGSGFQVRGVAVRGFEFGVPGSGFVVWGFGVWGFAVRGL